MAKRLYGSISRVHCDQTAGWIAFIFDMQVGVRHRHIVLDGHPNRPPNRGVKVSKFWVQLKGIGKFQAIVMKFCRATTVGTRKKCLPNFSSVAPQNRGVRVPKFRVQWEGVRNFKRWRWNFVQWLHWAQETRLPDFSLFQLSSRCHCTPTTISYLHKSIT